MDTIRVDKAKLLDILRKNRESHLDTFNKAMKGYQQKVEEWLEVRLAAAQAGRIPDMIFNCQHPMNQTKDYDRAIGMLEMHLDDHVELDEAEYRNYILDEWSWARQAAVTNKSYVGYTKSSSV